jgi:predicted amidohydrolase YtcJ
MTTDATRGATRKKESTMYRFLLALPFLWGTSPLAAAAPAAKGPADLIIHHAKVVTLDAKSRTFEAVAVKSGRIIALGNDEPVLKLRGPKTRVIDADGQTVLPGLYDSHVHPLSAATSELSAPLPNLKSLKDVFAYIRKKAASTPEGEWIVLPYAFPTRLKEARFPTKAELDKAAPKHPVLYHAGPAGLVNSMGLKVSGVTRDTPNPPNGVVVKDPKTGEPTGMLRNAYGVLKGVPRQSEKFTTAAKRAALKKLFALYNAQGLTSIADRNAGRESLDLYLDLRRKGELTLRVNVARSFNPNGSRGEIVKRLEELPGKDKQGGPTGAGDEWVRIGPIKLFLDGGMLNGTAYMRQPWPKGDTYQIVEKNYRGLLFIPPKQLAMVLEEAARRRWQMTAHTAGEGAMDVLLDAYELVNRQTSIKDRRWCITHANFPSQRNLERCKELGVCADVQPAWLWKDGATLARVLGAKRVRWFQPYRSWLKYTTIGGGSDHMIKLDSLEAVNPWNPWLGMWVALTRSTERGQPLMPSERLTREHALRLYTVNNAYLHHEEKEKGSLEVGKLGDLIVIDRDVLTCPVNDVRHTRVRYTVVGGKVVYERN